MLYIDKRGKNRYLDCSITVRDLSTEKGCVCMSQLKMYLYLQPSECEDSFNGFTYRCYNGTQADRDAWLEICKTGELLDYEGNAFERYITSQEGYRQDLTFFVLDGEKPIATITILDKQKRIAVLDREEMLGYVHMVGVHSDYCGRGLGGFLNRIALAALWRIGCQGAWLTTDDWRIPAIRSYLRSGFRPVLYEDDM